MKPAKPVHGTCKLVTLFGGVQFLIINKTKYRVEVLNPDPRVADPAVKLIKENGEEYVVHVDAAWGVECSCPDFSYRRRFCKHISALMAVHLIPKERNRGQTSSASGPCRVVEPNAVQEER